MTPPRTTTTARPEVAAFPVFRVVIAPDGASATLNGQPIPTADHPDLLTAVHAAASTAAHALGRPVRMDLIIPTGRTRHLTAHPAGQAAAPAVPSAQVIPTAAPTKPIEPVRAEPVPVAVAEPAPAEPVAAEPSRAESITAPGPLPPRGAAVPTPETTPITPPAPPVNGTSQHRRLTSLADPVPHQADTRTVPEPCPAGEPSMTADTSDTAPAVLAPAGLLPRLRPTTARPTVGWQARVHTWTRGRWSPPPSQAEITHRGLVAAVQAGFTGPRLVAVVNPKGGAGKTPAVLATAATFGAHRGSVIAWDDNETRGTLAIRALADPRNPTVAGLLADLDRFDRPSARVGDLAAHTRPQGGARFDVLASDDDPARMAQFGAAEFTRVRDVLARFYGLTVVDTGNNVRAGNWQAAVDAADQLLLVSTYQRDAAVTASWTLDHLHATGRGELADRAVTVLSAATPTTDRATRAELRDHFTARTRAVVEIPYDPVIADGEHLDLHALRPATREAWLAATAALTNGLSR